MSHIPNSAMPHAAVKAETDTLRRPRLSLFDRAGRLAEKARENPATVAVAGAAVLGAIAAAAIPLTRAARSKPAARSAPKKGAAPKSGTSGSGTAKTAGRKSGAGRSSAKKTG